MLHGERLRLPCLIGCVILAFYPCCGFLSVCELWGAFEKTFLIESQKFQEVPISDGCHAVTYSLNFTHLFLCVSFGWVFLLLKKTLHISWDISFQI